MVENNKNMCTYILPLFYVYTFFNVFISGISNIPSIFSTLIVAFRCFVYLFMAFSIFISIKKFDFKLIFYILIFVFAIIISLVSFLNTDIPIRFKEYLYTIIFTIIPLTISLYFSDCNFLLEKLANLGFIFGFLYALIGLFALKGIIILPSYDMSMGYCVIIPMCCLLYLIFKGKVKNKLLSIVSFISYLIFTIVFASRGPLMGILVFILYLLLFSSNNSKKLSKFIIIIILFLAMFFYVPILNFSSKVLNEFGIRSRTIDLIVNNDIYHSSGRELIYSVITDRIKENPFVIRGISSETKITYKNQYAHNMYLEILYQFGIIPGLIFLIIITFMMLSDLKIRILNNNPLVSILLVISFVTLQFSSSIWLYYNFWMWFILHIKEKKVCVMYEKFKK